MEQIKLRNDFYRDNFRRITLILLVSIIINVLVIILLCVSLSSKPAPRYFATTTDGQLIQLHSLDAPLLTESALISWISNAMPNINMLNFLNYRTQIDAKRKYFTQFGWQQYLSAFQPIVQKVVRNKYIMKGTLSGVPVVIQKGKLDGIYSWKLEVPLLITYQEGSKQTQKNVIWTIVIQRDNSHQGSPLGISQIIQQDRDDQL